MAAHWWFMSNAPKGRGQRVDLMTYSGDIVFDCHHAQDLSGEEQPPFSGWFRPSSSGQTFIEVPDPMFWRTPRC